MKLSRAAALVILLWGGCAQARKIERPMKVELDALSGRPNPSWTLTPEETAELERRLRGLRATEREALEPGLGYRGFLLSAPDRQIRIYQGLVTIVEGGVPRRYDDTNRIEAWLAEQAKAHGYAALISGIAGVGG